ncbi:MAG: helix-turn-helix transcriptional regulator [Tepidiformaceae bacterium]
MHQDLSPREREVVALVAEGKTNREIALETGLAPSTVKEYVANACHKAGVTNRVGLTAWWIHQGEDSA